MNAFFVILLYLLVGFIITSIRLCVYNIDLDDFTNLVSYENDDEQFITVVVLIGWPIYILLKLALMLPKTIAILLQKYIKKGDEE